MPIDLAFQTQMTISPGLVAPRGMTSLMQMLAVMLLLSSSYHYIFHSVLRPKRDALAKITFSFQNSSYADVFVF